MERKRQGKGLIIAFILVLIAVVIGLGVMMFGGESRSPKRSPDPRPVVFVVPDSGATIAPSPDPVPPDSGVGQEPERPRLAEAHVETEKVPRAMVVSPKSAGAPKRSAPAETAETEKAAEAPEADEAPDAGPGPLDAGKAAPAEKPPEETIEKAEVAILAREELPWLKMTGIEVNVDGRTIANFTSKEGIAADKDVPIFSGPLQVGRHRMNLTIRFIGDSAVFSYLEGYNFILKHAMLFESHPGRATRAVIVATPRGDITQDWKDRVALRVDVD